MKIAILTIGTRGDVQPYAVLGKALKQHGHEVTLATAKNFAELVSAYNIDFVPVEADFQALLESAAGKKMMKGNPFVIKRNLNTWLYPLIINSLTAFYQLARESDIVLYHVKTLADAFADQFPYKMIRTNVLPVVEPTTEFANPAFSGLPIPPFLYRLTYTFSNLSIKLLSKPIGQFRQKANLQMKFTVPQVRNIYGISPHFLPLPNDYPTDSRFTGFWLDSSTTPLTDVLISFIEAGPPPLLITFGSMPFKTKFNLQHTILRIAEALDTRIIVVKGWGFSETGLLDTNQRIKVIASAPYEKLFPLTKAIIHHGGIGTTAACLHAGKPFMICPILYPIGDQQFWGQHAYKNGLAVKPIPLSKMTEDVFIASTKELLSNHILYENASKMQVLIKREDGLKHAIAEIEKIANIHLS